MSSREPSPARELPRQERTAGRAAHPASRNIRRLLTGVTFVYLLTVAVLLIVLERWGERQWLLSLLLFVPPQILLLPLVLLVPLALLVRPSLCLWLAGAAGLVVFGYMTFRWTPNVFPDSHTLTVITHNVGQGNRAQFAKFLADEQPDVLLLQDAQHRAPGLQIAFPGSTVESRGEFVIVSRHLIQQTELLRQPRWRGRPVAARYVIIFQGQPLAIYSVHMPTPRHEFSRFLSPRIAKDLLEDGEPSSQLVNYREWIGERVELARALAEVFRAEKLPFIVGGDFNMPDHGSMYHFFAGEMSDAFAKSGRGWGLTFPGGMHFPVSLLGPWLRLDYLFAGRGWEPISCAAESGVQSQHRAVVARFNPAPRPSP